MAARLFLFSDTQIHHLFGKRTFAQSPFADRMSFEVAVRPAALDDGADLILAAFLAERRDHYPRYQPLFLGDAADISCTEEFDAFADVVRRGGALPLLTVTSNHDGYFVGNFTSRADLDGKLAATDLPDDWLRACAEPGSFDDHRLTKGRAVGRLLAMLPDAPPWATSSSWEGSEGPQDYRRVHLYDVRPLGGGDAGAPAIWGVFLDTVDYDELDLTRTEGAGRVGAVSRRQLRFLDRAMFEARAAGAAYFVVFGHHPVDELDRHSREQLLRFFDVRPEILGYVTAHTHSPFERHQLLPGGRVLPELIVGSTTDMPNAGALLEVHVDSAGRRASLATWRLLLDREQMCADVPPLEPTALGYTGYRILRDNEPDPEIGSVDKLLFATGFSELERQRNLLTVGALLVENELVRAWADLHLRAPDGGGADAGLLRGIVDRRFAAGAGFAAVRPWLEGRAQPGKLGPWDVWWDPVVAHVARVAAAGLHGFAPHADAFRRLRDRRTATPTLEHWFLCHALHAAAAEDRRPRRSGNVLYIR
ncbi:MAG TPA: hypothetical protein VL172_22635 [Kofleriaceae bacterium]|nr:hypothetical protein [Kofleriaceae bacterium]